MAQRAPVPATSLRVAIAGSPNAGKSSLFNRLTGLRQKVANYPGVTVEKKLGTCRLGGIETEVIDLPGAYSLTVQSPDEEVARDILLGWQADTPAPDVVVCVVDAANLERNLFLATQIIELGYPTVIALNMVDLAERQGFRTDPAKLSEQLGVEVVPTVASRGEGTEQLREAILRARPGTSQAPLPEALRRVADGLAADLTERWHVEPAFALGVALRLLSSPDALSLAKERWGPELVTRLQQARAELDAAGLPWQGVEASARYPWLREMAAVAALDRPRSEDVTAADRLDRVLTHPVSGLLVFALLMGAVFQSIYAWAGPFMDLIDGSFGAIGGWLAAHLPPGVLTDLLVNGVVAGVGGVLVFLPQIVFLFLFLALLEDSGYMARAAFVMDRLMSRVGLHGRSFVPLLSSMACAVPGVMAARTIGSRRDRLVTILVCPLMTCPARLPVYALLIAAFVPARPVLGGVLTSQGLALLSLYLLGTFAALGVAALLKKTVLRGPVPAMVLELPSYRVPSWRHIARDLWDRAWLFLRFAGSVILSMSILLWFLASFPRLRTPVTETDAVASLTARGQPAGDPAAVAAEVDHLNAQRQLEQSAMGRMGRTVEPVFRPLGFDWRISVGLMASFAAREVMVSTMGILFAVGDDSDPGNASLMRRLREARHDDGTPLFTTPVVWSLLIFFVFACQCMSTIGVVVRETGGWKWAGSMFAYMSVLAYVFSLVTFQGLRALGWG